VDYEQKREIEFSSLEAQTSIALLTFATGLKMSQTPVLQKEHCPKEKF